MGIDSRIVDKYVKAVKKNNKEDLIYETFILSKFRIERTCIGIEKKKIEYNHRGGHSETRIFSRHCSREFLGSAIQVSLGNNKFSIFSNFVSVC